MKFIRAAIFLLLAFAVAAHGGVEEWPRAIFETGVAFLFLAWAVRAYLQREEQLVLSPLLPPLATFALFVFGQWFFRATAAPFLTRTELQLLLADILLLFLAAQAFRTLAEWRSFIWFVMIFGFLVAVFGILQHLTFNGKLYWFREMRYGGIPFGPYVNRNHFAGFAEMVIPASLVPLVLGKVRRERMVIVVLFAFVTIGALILSASRGGIVSLGVELVLILILLIFRRTSRRHALAGGAVVVLAMVLVSWIGVGQVLQRFSSFQSLEVTEGKRASMRSDTWRIFLDHPWIGTGLGTLQTVFPPYESRYDSKVVNHTHNDYLEALAETGLVGGLCCAWFLLVLVKESLRKLSPASSPMEVSLHFSGLVGCIGLLVHSLVDFNLHIPANAALFFLLAQLATGEFQHVPANLPNRRRSARG